MNKQNNKPLPEIEELLPLPDRHWNILMILGEGTPIHGYRINKELARLTEKRLSPTSLYRHLAELVDINLIEETDPPEGETSTDVRRIYYKVSTFGKDVVKAEIKRVRLAESKPAFAFVPIFGAGKS